MEAQNITFDQSRQAQAEKQSTIISSTGNNSSIHNVKQSSINSFQLSKSDLTKLIKIKDAQDIFD